MAVSQTDSLSLHDALPIFQRALPRNGAAFELQDVALGHRQEILRMRSGADVHRLALDRKSTRLNSSHVAISYGVFCLKQKRRNGMQQHSSLIPPSGLRTSE